MPSAASAWRPSVSPWLIAASVMLATFMEILDTSVANVYYVKVVQRVPLKIVFDERPAAG